MIVWCKSCDEPITYRNGAGLRWPHYRSGVDRPTCLSCSVAQLDATAAELAAQQAATANRPRCGDLGEGGQLSQTPPEPVWFPARPSCLIFRFCCRICGGDVDVHDDRWFPQCAHCEAIERRKLHDELFRKAMAELDDDAGLTVAYRRHWPADARD